MPVRPSATVPPGSAIFTMPPRVVLNNAQELRREAVEMVVESAPNQLVLDLSGVEFIDSSGIGVLVSLLKTMRSRGGDLLLLEPQMSVRMLLDMTRLSSVFAIEPAHAQGG